MSFTPIKRSTFYCDVERVGHYLCLRNPTAADRFLDADFSESHCLRLRSEMELLHFQGWGQGSAAALRFRTANALRSTNHLHVSGRQQFEEALVEAKVAYGIPDLAILNVPHSIARQARK